MATRTGKVILAKGIRLDRSYKNVLSYTESQMLNLVTTKKIFEGTDFSFVRPDGNQIDIEIPYGTALQSNYMAFQNPDYSNKWFFAFIDSVEYISNKTTRFTFTIDEFATWYDYWNPKQCFVVREHVNDDTVGAHTVPEGLELGELVQNSSTNFEPDRTVWTSGQGEQLVNKYMIIFQVSELPTGSYGISRPHRYNSVYSGLFYLGVKTPSDATALISKYAGESKPSSIVAIFLAPTAFFDDCQFSNIMTDYGNVTVYFPAEDTGVSDMSDNGYSISRPVSLNGYTPKNNKMYTHPFSYIMVDNNAGMCLTERFEDFTNSAAPSYYMGGALGQGCSIKLSPIAYKGSIAENYNESITAMKLPICGWSTDYYTNWLTQNALNIPLTIASAVGSAALGIASGGAGLAAAGGALLGAGSKIANLLAEQYKAQLVPDQAHGNTNCSDINIAANHFFTVKCMSVKYEYAKIIDDFFTCYGYRVNSLKIPNQTGRPHWNFVQIADGDDIGFTKDTISVPTKSMDTINNIYRAGVTIWHNHDEIGNYALDNSLGQ